MRWQLTALGLGVVATAAILGAEQIAIRLDYALGEKQKKWIEDTKKSTDLDLKIGRELRFTRFLPRVTLQADDIRLSNVPGAEIDTLVNIRSVTASISLLHAIFALKDGHLELDELVVVEPHVVIQPDQAGRSNLSVVLEHLGRDAAKPAKAPWTIAIDRLVVQGGQIDFQRAQRGPVDTVRGLQIKGTASTSDKMFDGKAEAKLGDVLLTFEPLTIIRDKDAIGVALRAKSDNAEIVIKGSYASGTFAGTTTVQTAAVGPAYAEMARMMQMSEAALPFPSTLGMKLEGQMVASSAGFSANPIAIELGPDAGSGSIAIDFTSPRRLEVALDLKSLDLRRWTFPKKAAALPPDCARPSEPAPFGDLALDLKATIKAMKYASADISNIDLNLRSRNRVVSVLRLAADLPGGMKVDARSNPTGPGVSAKGAITVKAPRLRDTLRAFEVDLSRLRDDAMAEFELEARVEWGEQHTLFSDLALRLDEVRGRGSLSFTPGPLAVIHGALSLESADFGRYVPKGEFEAYTVKGSGVDVSAALSMPGENASCLTLTAAKVDVGQIDATGMRQSSGGTVPNAADAAANSIARLVADIGDVPQEVRNLLTVGRFEASIGSLLFSRIESALPHLGPILSRINTVTPIKLFAGTMIIREEGEQRGSTAIPLTLSNLRLAVGVHPVTTPEPPTQRQRATFDLAVSDVAAPGFHIVRAEAEATMDFSVGNGSAQIIQLSLDNLQVSGGLDDHVRTAGMPRITGVGEPVRNLPFTLSGNLSAGQHGVTGMLHTLEIGDIFSAEKVSIGITREPNQPLTVAISTTDARSLAGRNQPWSRAGLNLNTFTPVAAPCRTPLTTRTQTAVANILLRGKLTKLSEAYALLDGPATASQPILQAISIQGSVSDGGLVLSDFSAYLAGKSTLSLRLSAVPYADDFGTESLEMGGCLSTTTAMQDAPPLQAGVFRKLFLGDKKEWTAGDVVKLDIDGRFRVDGSQMTSLDPLSMKIEMQQNDKGNVESVAATTRTVRLQSVAFDDLERSFTLSLGRTKVMYEGTTLLLEAPARHPPIEIIYAPRASLPCGRGPKLDATVNLGRLTIESVQAARAFWARWEKVPGRHAQGSTIEQPKEDAASCAEWSVSGKIAGVDAVADTVAVVLHGRPTGGRPSDRSQLEDITVNLVGKATGEIAYKVGATLTAQPGVLPSQCKPLKKTDVALRRQINAGARDRRVEVDGQWPRGDSKIWAGEMFARMRCIDLRYLLSIHEATTQEPLPKFATLKYGMIEELSFEKKDGEFSAFTGHLDFDAYVTAATAPSDWPWWLRFIAKSLAQSLSTGLPVSTRLDAKNGLLAGTVESLDPHVHEPGHKYYWFARKFPHVFKASTGRNTRIGRWDFDVEVKSPGEWSSPQYDHHCSRGSEQVPRFHQIFYGVCLWNCGEETLRSMLRRIANPDKCNR